MSHYFAMFGGHWSIASGDAKHLICHVTSLKHVIEGSSNFMSGSYSSCATTLLSLVVIDIAVVEMLIK